MNILVISDTHGFHNQFNESDFIGIDMIIHAGDFGNSRSPYVNSNECIDFLSWYNNLNVKYKILIAGNHDTSIEAKLINPRDYKDITYLEHESINIEGINIFGSPYTPKFFDWAFNVDRNELYNFWKEIPNKTDILITHGPPKGILDLAYNHNRDLEYCGDEALMSRIKELNIKYNIFGHIHNNEDNHNSGERTVSFSKTKFINASCVTDGEFYNGLTSKGILFKLE